MNNEGKIKRERVERGHFRQSCSSRSCSSKSVVIAVFFLQLTKRSAGLGQYIFEQAARIINNYNLNCSTDVFSRHPCYSSKPAWSPFLPPPLHFLLSFKKCPWRELLFITRSCEVAFFPQHDSRFNSPWDQTRACFFVHVKKKQRGFWLVLNVLIWQSSDYTVEWWTHDSPEVFLSFPTSIVGNAESQKHMKEVKDIRKTIYRFIIPLWLASVVWWHCFHQIVLWTCLWTNFPIASSLRRARLLWAEASHAGVGSPVCRRDVAEQARSASQ